MGDRTWNLKEASDILVTLSEGLNIIIPANDASPAIYIDVPIKSIQEVSFDKDSQQPTYGVVIRLMDGSATNCILNATQYTERHVALAFASEKEVNTLRRLLTPTTFQTNRLPPRSQPMLTDISESILSDGESAEPGPALSNGQILMRTASLASTVVPHNNALSTINPSLLERVQTHQHAFADHQEGSLSSIVEHDEGPHRVHHSMYMAVEGNNIPQNDVLLQQANESIDVFQTDGLSHKETETQDVQARLIDTASFNARDPYSQDFSNGTQENKRHFDRTSDTGPSSSLRWHTDLNAIQDAPEFRARHPQQSFSSIESAVEPAVEPTESKNRLDGQDGEHDDLYDASPKAQDGRRRSPRLLAGENILKRVEPILESTARQARVRAGPPKKLSRQLRNADGVVESRAERRVDDDLAASTSKGAMKTSAKSKKSKVPAAAKVLKESITPNKKTRQSNGKAFVTEEPPNASLDNYDLPPSPTPVGSALQRSENKKKAKATPLRTTKRARNNSKKAKLVPTKVTTTTSFHGPAPQLKKGFKNKAKLNDSTRGSVPSRPNDKKVDEDDNAIWDIDQAQSNEEPQTLRQSRQPAKTGKKQELRAPKTEKTKAQTQLSPDKTKADRPPKPQTQAQVARLVKVKPAPAALSRRQPQRTAAIKANKKIQGLDGSDEIVDDEEIVPALTRSKLHVSSDAAKTPKSIKTRYGRDNRPKSGGKLPTTILSTKDSIADSVRPEYSDEQSPDAIADFNSGSSPEAPVKALRFAPGESRDSPGKETQTSAAVTSMIPVHSRDGDHSNQPNATSGEEDLEVRDARIDFVSNSVPQLNGSLTRTEPTPNRPQKDVAVKQGHDGLDTTIVAGPRDEEEVKHVLPYIDEAPLQFNSKPDSVEKEVATPQASTASKAVNTQQRRTSPRLAEAAQKSLLESTAKKRDPFGEKLNDLMREPKDTNAKVNSREVARDVIVESKRPKTLSSVEPARPSRAHKARVSDKTGVKSLEEVKRVEIPRKHMISALQVDGEGEGSLMPTLKPAGESISASRVEAKRKIEQIGNTSLKRVKLAPRDLFKDVSARKKPTYNARKAPPPVVSNKPSIIGFSKTGPRNQGTSSAKKPKPSLDVETGEPSTLELRKYDVPKSAINRVEVDFPSVQEALEVPSEDMQHEKKDRRSPPRKQDEPLKAVNTIITHKPNTQEHLAQKRKLTPFINNPAPWEHEQLLKRQKRDIVTPPTVHSYCPRMFPDLSPAVIHDRSQRLSSQNTRVNENGSPMPFFMTQNENTAATEQSPDEDDGKNALAEARLEEQVVLQDDDPTLPVPILPLRPLVSAISISQPKATAYQSLSSNSKQVPSSPHAPSAFGTLPPHHVYQDGEIVNAETMESIIPANPQDPFLGATQNPQNSFMNALRKSSEAAAKRLVPGANGKRAPDSVVMRPFVDVGEDPDKTLVEPKLRKKYKQVYVSDNSSSSQSGSSTQASQPYESSEEESDIETEVKWRVGLEPHQENILECLVNISHVSTIF